MVASAPPKGACVEMATTRAKADFLKVSAMKSKNEGCPVIDFFKSSYNLNGDYWPRTDNFVGPILERSAMIEGDVFLYQQRKHRNRAIPLMSAPLKIADRITFKEWLREVAKLRKG